MRFVAPWSVKYTKTLSSGPLNKQRIFKCQFVSKKESNEVYETIKFLPEVPQPVFTCSELTTEYTRRRCEICSKFTIKKPERWQYLYW